MKGGSKTGDPSMNGNFGFVIFESIDTAHKVLKSRVSLLSIKINTITFRYNKINCNMLL